MFKPEAIINKLREAEVLNRQGKSVAESYRALGITDQTYYRWRKEYGGMGTEQARRLMHRPTLACGQGHGQALERENAQLRKVLADLTLDNAILKEAAGSGGTRAGHTPRLGTPGVSSLGTTPQ